MATIRFGTVEHPGSVVEYDGPIDGLYSAMMEHKGEHAVCVVTTADGKVRLVFELLPFRERNGCLSLQPKQC